MPRRPQAPGRVSRGRWRERSGAGRASPSPFSSSRTRNPASLRSAGRRGALPAPQRRSGPSGGGGEVTAAAGSEGKGCSPSILRAGYSAILDPRDKKIHAVSPAPAAPPDPRRRPAPRRSPPAARWGGARRRRGPRRGSAGPGPSRRVSVCFCLRGERGGRAAPEPGAQPQARPGPPPPALLRARGRRGPPGAAPGPPEAEAEARPRSGPASPAAVAPPPRPARPVRDGSRPPPLFPAGPVRGPRGLRSPPPRRRHLPPGPALGRPGLCRLPPGAAGPRCRAAPCCRGGLAACAAGPPASPRVRNGVSRGYRRPASFYKLSIFFFACVRLLHSPPGGG